MSRSEMLGHPALFAEHVLGLNLYGWQIDALDDIFNGGRVALRAANGSGKTASVVTSAILWHAAVFPGSQVVTTAGVYRQVKDQLWRYIKSHAQKFEGWRFNETSLVAPNGATATSFTTTDAGKFEGYHGSLERPLMLIVDEAKTVPVPIFQAIDRCTYQRLLLTSSPGSPSGEFYDAFGKNAALFKRHVVKASDCPHIDPARTETLIRKWGLDHPLIRSMVFAEFMDADSAHEYVFDANSLDRAIESPPPKRGIKRIVGIDFAAGGDENVIVLREGNLIHPPIAWRDADTMRGVGRFVMELRKLNVKPSECWCDGGGVGKAMADRMRELGWDIHRINYGSPASNKEHYKNTITEMWHEAAASVSRNEFILPDDPELKAQLIGRKRVIESKGKLGMESKLDMRGRGLPSPDRADAVITAMTRRFMPEPKKLDYDFTSNRGWLEQASEHLNLDDQYDTGFRA